MSIPFTYTQFDPAGADHLSAAVEIWNAACGDDLALTVPFMAYNVGPAPRALAGWLALDEGTPAGFVLAGALDKGANPAPPGTGWIEALAVTPAAQRRGGGGALLAQAEAWLRLQGCTAVRVGSGLRPFVPGAPAETAAAAFFTAHGYAPRRPVYDVAADLSGYTPPGRTEVAGSVRPAAPGQEAALLDFLRAEFSGRWRWECQAFLEQGGRPADFMLLWTEQGVTGFCQLTFPDSARPIERYYPYRLPKPWGQLGPIGVAEAARGRGYGAALLDAGLRRLHNNGINGCVIDWTDQEAFYGRFGFTRYREYLQLDKALD